MAGADAVGPLLILTAVVLAWLTGLTVTLVRWRRRQGEPVYRRLPDGRVRFEWHVSRAYQKARHAGSPEADQTSPIPAVPRPAGIGPSNAH